MCWTSAALRGYIVLDEVDTLNYVGVSDMPPVPVPIPLHTVFVKILSAKSNFAIDSRNIYIAREI